MSFFGDTDVTEIDDDPFSVPTGTHAFIITKAEVRESKSTPGNEGLQVTFSMEDDPVRNISYWNSLPKDGGDPEVNKRNLTYLKKFFKEIGVPESRMQTITGEDLIGMRVKATATDGKNGYKQIGRFAPMDEDFTPTGDATEFGEGEEDAMADLLKS